MSSASDRPETLHALTVDVEDWYHRFGFSPQTRERLPKRLDVGLGRLLDTLSEFNVRATFFVLGDVAVGHPDLVRRIADGGHEIGTHGGSHEPLWDTTRERFAVSLRGSIRRIEDTVGQKVIGHRAPFFSLDGGTAWALDSLFEAGIVYDSSVYPTVHPRYGVVGHPSVPHRLRAPSGGGLFEFPLAVVPAFGLRVPVAGGAYLRIWPLSVTLWGARRLAKLGRSSAFYVHPWELDPDQPRVQLRDWRRFTYYHRLDRTEGKLRTLLARFRFSPIREVYSNVLSGSTNVPLFDLKPSR
jgi:polysaccharide deacetylase family protein (PEP-CTERM system associated)